MAKSAKRFSAPRTENAWHAERDLGALLAGLGALARDGRTHLTNRRFQLFAAALARSVSHLLPSDEWRDAIALAEQYAEDQKGSEAFFRTRSTLSFLHSDPSGPPGSDEARRGCAQNVVLFSLKADGGTDRPVHTDTLKWAANWAADALLDPRLFRSGASAQGVARAKRATQSEQVRVLRDIFGNPFRAVPLSASWRSDTAVWIARQMYESRDFSAMPILADALQDAGCDCADVLDHCRGTSPVHVRGCWVVDLVLGKA